MADVSNTKTPKGRPKKGSKATNFKPKKLDFSKHDAPTNSMESNDPSSSSSSNNNQNDLSGSLGPLTTTLYRGLNIEYSAVSDVTMNRKSIVKLGNYGENICFFNSCCQALYSLDFFHTYLEQTTIDHPVITKLKELFQTMRNKNGIVKSFDFMLQIQEYFRDYVPKRQYDAEECLSTILRICFPDIHNAASDTEFNKFDSQFIFGVTYNETIECEQNKGGCGKTQDRYEHDQILKLTVKETSEFEQSVEQLLNSPSDRDPMPEGYRCDIFPLPCNRYNTCNKQSILSELKDGLVIQLIIYSYDEFGHQRKFFPNIHVNQHIIQFAQYNLKAIIWHHGDSLQSGHYTVMVKQQNNQWIHISDTNTTTYSIQFDCCQGDESVPYILIYTKNDANDTQILENQRQIQI